jgi:DNA repair exonuclease SbcCD ATPase subunit
MKTTKINQIQIEAENLGGLPGKTRLEIMPGINVIEAPNASGKTSIVSAFMLSVLPPKEAPQHTHILHSAETRGQVRLNFDGQKIERIIQRSGKGKDTSVEILGESVARGHELGLIRRYAVADEQNPVLVKVRAGDDLKDVLMEYSGVEELKAEHEKLIKEKSDLQGKLKAGQEKIKKIESLKKDLKGKEKRLEELESEKKKVREKKPSEEETELVELEGEIARAQADLNATADSIKLTESIIKSRKEKLKVLEQRAVGGLEDIIKEINEKEDEIKALEKDKLELEKKYSLKGSELSHLRFIVSSAPAYAAAGEDKLTALLPVEDQDIICPVCDHKTKYGQVKAKLQKTDDEVKEINGKKSELEDKINKLNKKITELGAKKTEKNASEAEQKRILDELPGLEKSYSRKKEELNSIEAKLGELTSLKEKLLKKRKEKASESQNQSIELEKDLAVISSGIDRIKGELKSLASASADLNAMDERYKTIEQRIKELESEIDERENGIVRLFNAEIMTIYKKMGFAKVDELKLSKKGSEFKFDVVRKSKAGAGYMDTHSVKSLSKTEREVAGLILLLSGYRAFRVAEKYPLFIIDEISFMDPQRMRTFIDHIKETAKAVILTTVPGREIELPDVNHISLENL